MIQELELVPMCSTPIAPPRSCICTKVTFFGGVLVIGMELDGVGYQLCQVVTSEFQFSEQPE